MQFEPQLPHMHADRAVLHHAVVLRLAEHRAADAMFAQILGLAVQGSLRQKAQQISQAGRLLEGTAGGDLLDQLPPGVCLEIRIHFHHRSIFPLPFDPFPRQQFSAQPGRHRLHDES